MEYQFSHFFVHGMFLNNILMYSSVSIMLHGIFRSQILYAVSLSYRTADYWHFLLRIWHMPQYEFDDDYSCLLYTSDAADE